MAGKRRFRGELIAPCGMDCAICMAYLREKDHCPGCSAANHEYRRGCTIASCQKRRGRYCDCTELPCRRLRQLDTRYRTKYRMSMLGNLEAIRKNGVRGFLKSQREHWTCPGCGGIINVHRGTCSVCGKERESRA